VLSVHVVAGAQPLQVHVVAGPGTPPRPVYVYADPAYAPLLTSFRAEKGLFDHLAITLPGGGYDAPVRRVDAGGLAAAILDPRSLVVVGAGALPETVLGPGRDWAPVKAFLEAGGELVFTGDGVFYWAARPGMSAYSLTDRRARIDWAGARDVLGYDLVHDPAGDPRGQISGSSPSSTAAVLGISYQLAQRGARLGPLQTAGGWDVGLDATGGLGSPRTSLAVVPVGRGRLVLFGSGLFGFEPSTADDIARVVLSGADQALPLGTASFVVDDGARRTVSVPIFPAPGPEGLRVLVYDAAGFIYFHRTLSVAALAGTAFPTPSPSPTPGAAESPSPSASP
jgi:hypothetical protein